MTKQKISELEDEIVNLQEEIGELKDELETKNSELDDLQFRLEKNLETVQTLLKSIDDVNFNMWYVQDIEWCNDLIVDLVNTASQFSELYET